MATQYSSFRSKNRIADRATGRSPVKVWISSDIKPDQLFTKNQKVQSALSISERTPPIISAGEENTAFHTINFCIGHNLFLFYYGSEMSSRIGSVLYIVWMHDYDHNGAILRKVNGSSIIH